MPKHIEIARQSVLLAGMPPTDTDEILENSSIQSYERGATLFTQGDPAEKIYIVSDGWVKLSRISQNGSEAIVGVFNEGECIAVPVSLRRGKYPATCSAATDTTVVEIDAAILLNLLRNNPETALALVVSTFSHLHQLVDQIEQLKVRNAIQRVSDFLLELAPAEDGPCDVELPYDKALIAGKLGLAPASLSRTFKKLRPHGIRIRKEIVEIEDIAALRAITAEDP